MVAEPVTLATWHVDLSRKGPGLLLRDLLRGKLGHVVGEIARADPDLLLLTDIDHDHDGVALAQLADMLAEAGAVYPHRITARPNSGMPTGLDLDGDRAGLAGPGMRRATGISPGRAAWRSCHVCR